MTAHIRKSSAWKTIQNIYIRTGGQWKSVTKGFVRASGAWRQFFSSLSTPSISQQVAISKATDGTTYLITLTGTNYNWTNTPTSLTFAFQKSTDAESTWTDITNGTITNPAVGSSNTKTYELPAGSPSTGVTPNILNYYRFTVTATNGVGSTTSTSTSTTVQGPTNITLTAGTPGKNSIPVTWTSSTGANKYLVEYKTNASSTWLEYSWTGATYETLTGLSQNVTYNIRVTPYTSNSLTSTYKGYPGNTSNTVTATTPILPGIITGLENYNFSAGNAQLFFTTGTNTSSVQYTFNSSNISGFSIGPFTQSASSSTPYKYQHNLLSYFTLRTWNNDTYNPSTTYYENNTVWYAGNNYTAKLQSFSGITPPNTTYWNVSQVFASPWSSTTAYSAGNKVWYNGDIYTCNVSNTNNLPTNYIYWSYTQSFPNTYSSGTSYSLNGSNSGTSSSADYQGTRYTAKDPGFSGQTPTNTAYWNKTTTVTYNAGDYVLYSGTYYFARSSFDGFYPTNTTYWASNYAAFTTTITPYNGLIDGSQFTSSSTIFIRADGQSSDPLRISSGPTFSSITQTAFTSNFTPSVYTNAVYFYIKQGGTNISGYPRQIGVTGATATSHISQTTLTSGVTYTVEITARYIYNQSFGILHDGETSSPQSVTTLVPSLTPTFGSNTPGANQFTGSVTNYDTSYTWIVSVSAGTFSWTSPASNGTRTFSVTSLSDGQSSTVSITTQKAGAADGFASTSGSALLAALTPTFGSNTRTASGFDGSVTNYDSNYSFSLSASSGTVSPTTFSGTGTTKTFSVTGLSPGASSTVTVNTSRSGYKSGSGATSSSALNTGLTPTFGANASGTGLFAGSVTNYDTNYTWSISVTAGTFTWGSIPGSNPGTRTFTVSGLGIGQSSTVTATTSRTGYTTLSAQTTGSASSNVAPNNGSVTISVLSGTAGRIGTSYYVSAASASGTPTPSVNAYQWQYFSNATSTWSSISGATSSSYTVNWNENSGTIAMAGRDIRCLVTFSNGVSPNLDTGSNSQNISNPTITGVTATLSLTSPFILYRVYGYNFRSIESKNRYGLTTPPGTIDANYTYSQSNNATVPITRQSGNGGDLYYYQLEVAPYDKIGTGSAPTSPFSKGSTIFTTIVRNNATNRTNSPVNVYGTGSA